MKKILRLLGLGFLYFAVATVLAQAAGLVVLWQKGHLGEDRTLAFLASLQGIELPKIEEEGPDKDPQVVYEEVLQRRVMESLNLDLRQSALDRGVAEVLVQQRRLGESRAQYNTMLNQFEARLAEMQRGADDEAFASVRQTLESLQPAQAKAQLLLMMDGGRIADVVAILNSMTADKRKKITNEFTEEESEKFHDIIQQMLTGSGQRNLVDQARDQVDRFRDDQT